MPNAYLSPGVYVKEVASGSAPIAGVGTSTAGFIGVIKRMSEDNPSEGLELITEESIPVGSDDKKVFTLKNHPGTENIICKVKVNGSEAPTANISQNATTQRHQVNVTSVDVSPITSIKVEYWGRKPSSVPTQAISVSTQEVKLCTNFGEFKKFFGDFSEEPGQNTLAHAIYGFFRNGGTRCFVVWVTGEDKIDSALEQFEAIDEIAIVAAPGILGVRDKINDHCKNLGDRVAILDSNSEVDLSNPEQVANLKPFDSKYAALYFPWIQVLDPITNQEKYVPPSGHIAGIYARVDSQRGVHKAPANETLLGAVGLKYNISKAKQDGLNPQGINCIRNLNGNIKVWGARTLGGDANDEFKYINVRRLFNYLKKSIDEGTQWTVFEPNSPELWARIRRNVTAFLMIVWRSGALFGNTPEQAFYVKCDEETNPPELREQGQVVTEIGVAVVKPAEFVIFHLSQWSGPGK